MPKKKASPANSLAGTNPTKEEIDRFSVDVIRLAHEKRVNHIDAVLLYCEQHNKDVEIVAALLSPVLKAKIRQEAENLHFIKPTNKRLPI